MYLLYVKHIRRTWSKKHTRNNKTGYFRIISSGGINGKTPATYNSLIENKKENLLVSTETLIKGIVDHTLEEIEKANYNIIDLNKQIRFLYSKIEHSQKRISELKFDRYFESLTNLIDIWSNELVIQQI